jgi:hypothetical protein
MTLSLGQVQLYAAKEIIGEGTSAKTTYSAYYTFPIFNVTRISFSTSLDKQVTPQPPNEDDDNPSPIIICMGVKTKEITSITGFFKYSSYAYSTTNIIGTLSDYLKENVILMIKDSTSFDNFPELEGAPLNGKQIGLWKIKNARWSTDSKSLLNIVDLNLKYVWVDPQESMFFGSD